MVSIFFHVEDYCYSLILRHPIYYKKVNLILRYPRPLDLKKENNLLHTMCSLHQTTIAKIYLIYFIRYISNILSHISSQLSNIYLIDPYLNEIFLLCKTNEIPCTWMICTWEERQKILYEAIDATLNKRKTCCTYFMKKYTFIKRKREIANNFKEC